MAEQDSPHMLTMPSRHSVARILCPLTLSSRDRATVERAGAFARLYDAELRLFHVRDASRGDDDPEHLLTELDALASDLPRPTRVSAAVTDGDPASEIVRHAALCRADLIAIGVAAPGHDRGGVADRVMRDARCPVLAVPADASRPSDEAPCRIVCGVDFLPPSLDAAEQAFALAERARAHVTVAHVLSERWDGPARVDGAIDEIRRQLDTHFRQLLKIVVQDLAGRGAPQPGEAVLTGPPGAALVACARALDAGLIVVGSGSDRRRTRELGSTAAHVVREAPCPVLVVPPRWWTRLSRRALWDCESEATQ